jgi:hypothetical protein
MASRRAINVGIGMRPVGGGRVVGDFLVIDEPRDRAAQPHLPEVFDVLRAAAKTGAVHQMGGGRRIPLDPGSGSNI